MLSHLPTSTYKAGGRKNVQLWYSDVLDSESGKLYPITLMTLIWCFGDLTLDIANDNVCQLRSHYNN